MPDTVRLRPRSFESLDQLPQEPQWLWDKMLGPQQLTMLAGRSFGGKSTLVMGLLAALAAGDPFLGLPTRQATALLLTEQNPYALRDQIDQFGCINTGHQVLTRADGLLSTAWEPMIQQATEIAVDNGHQLLVVDTFAGLANLQGEQENDAAAVTERLRVLQWATEFELAVLFLHHTGYAGVRARGSTAFNAAVDVSTTLIRNTTDKRLTLKTESRFAAPDDIKATLDLEGGRKSYLVNQTARAVDGYVDDQIIRRVAEDKTGIGMDRQAIAEAGFTPDVLKKRLPRLVEQGKLICRNVGRKGAPSRYSVP